MTPETENFLESFGFVWKELSDKSCSWYQIKRIRNNVVYIISIYDSTIWISEDRELKEYSMPFTLINFFNTLRTYESYIPRS